MLYMAGQVIESGVWFVILVTVLSFFWFHHRGKRRHPALVKRH